MDEDVKVDEKSKLTKMSKLTIKSKLTKMSKLMNLSTFIKNLHLPMVDFSTSGRFAGPKRNFTKRKEYQRRVK